MNGVCFNPVVVEEKPSAQQQPPDDHGDGYRWPVVVEDGEGRKGLAHWKLPRCQTDGMVGPLGSRCAGDADSFKMGRTGKLVDLHKKVKARRRRVQGPLAVCAGINDSISRLLGWFIVKSPMSLKKRVESLSEVHRYRFTRLETGANPRARPSLPCVAALKKT